MRERHEEKGHGRRTIKLMVELMGRLWVVQERRMLRGHIRPKTIASSMHNVESDRIKDRRDRKILVKGDNNLENLEWLNRSVVGESLRPINFCSKCKGNGSK